MNPQADTCMLRPASQISLAVDEPPSSSQAVAAAPVAPALRFRGNPAWKRGIDLVGAVLGLVVLSPVLVLVTCIIKLGSRGPVFFRQSRVGAMGRTFTIWKFRTMSTSVDQGRHTDYVRRQLQSNGSLHKLDRSDALVPCGGLLRSLALDELPQLLNVVRGEMSLVGPRPDVVAVAEYEPWQQARFEVLPGMTGLWQVSGKNDTTFVEMMELDVEYAGRRSLRLDMMILLKTPWAILRQVAMRAD